MNLYRTDDPPNTDRTQRNEVSSLIYRFHHAGWCHRSIYERNILCKYGPLDVSVEERVKDKGKRALSFRLIDFGRSCWIEDAVSESQWKEDRAHEEMLADKLFEHRLWDMRR